MKTNAYTIYDRKALIYNAPFFVATDGVATRELSNLVNDPNTTIGRHPNDYVLYCCGAYDDQLGSLLPESPLRHVMDASALVKLEPNIFAELSGVPGATLTNGKA